MSPHPLEALRYVARAWESDEEFPAQEVAALLADLASDSPASVLQACRRLIEHVPFCGPAWWLSARALAAAGTVEGIWDAAGELEEDPTPYLLARSLPASAVVAFLKPHGGLPSVVRRLRADLTEVKPVKADILVLRAIAAGPGALLVSSRADAVVSARSGAAVWGVVERGVLLPEGLWEQLTKRVAGRDDVTELAAAQLTTCACDAGNLPAREALATPTCAPVAELLDWR